MSATAARMLELLSLLQAPREWPGSELARRLEVSGRTLRRDIDRLRDLGYPIEATMGAVGGYRLVGGTAMPPLLLDDQEAVAIAVGLRTVVGHAVEGMEDASVRALAKLQQVLPPRLRARVGVLSAATGSFSWAAAEPVDPERLTVLAAAFANGERVRFDYAAADGAASLRTVEPHGLVAAGRRWYLVAWDQDRADWRTFRVDRLRDPRPLPGRVAPRELPAADAAAFVRAQHEGSARTFEGVAVVHAPAGVVRPRLPGGTEVEPMDDDRCRVRLAADTLEWLAFRLILLRQDFRVESPSELVDYVATVGVRLTRSGLLAPSRKPA